MILLGILSKYSWGDFLVFLFTIDGIVLAFGFALDKFVWTKDSVLTKTERRSQREEEDEGVERRDYRKLSESASDYNEVKSVDDSFDVEEDDYSQEYQEDGFNTTPNTADVADMLGGEDESQENEQEEEQDEEPAYSVDMDDDE